MKKTRIFLSTLIIIISLLLAVGSSSVDIFNEDAVIQDMQGTWVGHSHNGLGEFQYMHYKVKFDGEKFYGWIQSARTDREPGWNSKPDVTGTWSLSDVLTFTNSSSKYRNINIENDDENLLEARTLQKMIIWDNGLYVAAWGPMTQKSKSQKQTKNNPKEADKINYLTIIGDNIWVRDFPSTGEVIMKLNSGDKCEVLERGKFEEIRNMYDYWYKIKCNGKIGWVYGSQSNLKTDYTYADAVKKGLIKESKSKQDSPNTINNFFQKYSENSNNINRFIHPSIELMILNNPGAMCFGSKSSTVRVDELYIQTENIFKGIPEGSKCDGYENTKDGFYYENVNRDALPIFTTDGESINKLSLPGRYSSYELIKVCIIKDKWWQADFYFIKIDGNVYIICQDFCDCSS